jgi:DNA invertase Pin-like site-specific DNA recombinase
VGLGRAEVQGVPGPGDSSWHRGGFEVLVVWALDRLSRGGAEDTLRLLRRFREAGVAVVSLQEPWLGVDGMADVLIAFAGWVSQ